MKYALYAQANLKYKANEMGFDFLCRKQNTITGLELLILEGEYIKLDQPFNE